MSRGKDIGCIPEASSNAVAATLASGLALPLIEGRTYEVWYPFKRETYTRFEAEGCTDEPTWAPGWRYEGRDVGYGEAAFDAEWDGDGAMLLTVVSLHKPGKTYPERAFYVRQWRDPDGKVFGKKNLRIVSSRALVGWLNGGKTQHLNDDREAALASSEETFRRLLEAAANTPTPEGGAGNGTASNAGASQALRDEHQTATGEKG